MCRVDEQLVSRLAQEVVEKGTTKTEFRKPQTIHMIAESGYQEKAIRTFSRD